MKKITDEDIQKIINQPSAAPSVYSTVAQHAISADQMRATLRIYHGIELTVKESEAIYGSFEAKRKEE